MEVQHQDPLRECHLVHEARSSVGVEILASISAAALAGLFTYLALRAMRSLHQGAEAEVELEVAVEARHAHQPLPESPV